MEIYEDVCFNSPPVFVMNYVNAELSKLSINSFMTMKISFVNLLTGICDSMDGGDIDVVTDVVSQFGATGKKGLVGGLGYGGPCLPRDNLALSYLGNSFGISGNLPKTIDKISMFKKLGLNYCSAIF